MTIEVGTVINGKRVLNPTTKNNKPAWNCEHVSCGHKTVILDSTLRYERRSKGCRVCVTTAQQSSHDSMIGRKVGEFVVAARSTERRNNRPMWNLRCQNPECTHTETMSSSSVCNTKDNPYRCPVCQGRRLQERIKNNRRFTDDEAVQICYAMNGFHSIVGILDKIEHTSLDCTDDDIRQKAWEDLLKQDLNNRTLDEICGLACGIAKNIARRMWNPAPRFAEPYVDSVGDEVHPLDHVENPEPIYPSVHSEQADTLHEMLERLSVADRSLLLSDEGMLDADGKANRAELIRTLKNTLQ